MICAKWSLVVVSSGVILQDEEQKGLGQFVESKHLTGSRYICNSNGMSRPAEKRDNEGRLRQSRGLIEHFATGLGEVIIGGDFNISPDNGSIAMFARNGC